MELRNPSDALQILALSGDHAEDGQNTSPSSASDTVLQGRTVAVHGSPNDTQSMPTAFDDHELVQKGVLRPGLVSELLLKFVTSLHQVIVC